MTWWEVLISIPILAMAGAFAGHFMYQWEVRKHGQIKAERDEVHEVAMSLGVNPDDVRAMGLMWAASGMSVEDAERAARNFSRCGASIMKEDHGSDS